MRMDRAYLRSLISLALPIIFQQFITSALNLVDGLMVGQLGETAITAVGLAGQVGFIFLFMLFGINSGAGAFTAQLWGKGDAASVRRVLGLSVKLGLLGAAVFTLAALFAPEAILSLYTRDAQVAELGARVLRLSSFSYLFMAVDFSFEAVQRSTGNVRPPAVITAAAIAIKTLLNWLLIFGNLGFPHMGVEGAAIATLIARALQCAAIVAYTYLARTPVAASFRELLAFPREFLRPFMVTALPVMVNETLWALGISTYNAIYARISTQSLAAVNIASAIEGLAFVVFIGVSDACSILVGNRLGAGERDTAQRYGRWTLGLCITLALGVGALIFGASFLIPNWYRVSPDVIAYAQRIMWVMSLGLWVRVTNMVAIVGVMRAGGDTRFGLALDIGPLWLVGIPSVLVAAFVFHLPVYWVFALVYCEDLVKFGVGMLRIRSGRWMHDLTRQSA